MPYGFVSFPFEKATMLSTKEETRQWKRPELLLLKSSGEMKYTEYTAYNIYIYIYIHIYIMPCTSCVTAMRGWLVDVHHSFGSSWPCQTFPHNLNVYKRSHTTAYIFKEPANPIHKQIYLSILQWSSQSSPLPVR